MAFWGLCSEKARGLRKVPLYRIGGRSNSSKASCPACRDLSHTSGLCTPRAKEDFLRKWNFNTIPKLTGS